ncbi:MAG: hypothetical protein JO356_08000 [Acidobacteria bacterium]|nr:hypothetical protein [Acidobacteriota bacterium]
MDSPSVESLVTKLRDLAATKFVDSGFSTPTLDLTVSFDDGKRTDKVEIAKSANHYIAKRENEPALYELDSTSVEALLSAIGELKAAAAGSSESPKKP